MENRRPPGANRSGTVVQRTASEQRNPKQRGHWDGAQGSAALRKRHNIQSENRADASVQ